MERDIWSDDDGSWFDLRDPINGVIVLFGPFATIEEGRPSKGAEGAYDALIANGWTEEPRT